MCSHNGFVQGNTCSVGWCVGGEIRGKGLQMDRSCDMPIREDRDKTSAVVIREEKRVKFNKCLGGRIIQM